MDKHLGEFYRLIEECDAELQQSVFACSVMVLQRQRKRVADAMPNETDDVLQAAQKSRALEGKKVGDIIGWTDSTREGFAAAIKPIIEAGAFLPFVITSLVRAIEDTLAEPAGKDVEAERDKFRTTKEYMEDQKRADSIENAARWDELIAFGEEHIQAMPERIAKARDLYERWRSVFGERAAMSTFMGCWPDLLAEETYGKKHE